MASSFMTHGLRALSPLGFRWSQPMPPHSIENVGDSDIRLILTEFKEAPRS